MGLGAYDVKPALYLPPKSYQPAPTVLPAVRNAVIHSTGPGQGPVRKMLLGILG